MKNLKLVGLMVVVVLAAAACSRLGSSSPTATFKAFYEAQKKKDVAAVKKTLSKGTLAMLEKTTKEQNKTVDGAISEGLQKENTKAKLPETRNEKIDGNNATLELQDDETKKWDTMMFVKEDGDWKIAIDKMIEESMKKIGQPG